MTAGAEDLFAVHRLVTDLEDKFIPFKLWNEKSVFGRSSGIAYRLSKTILLDALTDWPLFLVQHEYFGHGARLREFFPGVQLDLWVSPLPPYGHGGGSIRISGTDQISGTPVQQAMIYAGGVEAAHVLAETVLLHAFEKDSISYRDAFVYLSSELNLPFYVDALTNAHHNVSGNDIAGYLNSLQLLDSSRSFADHLADLKRESLIYLLDPSLYSAFLNFTVAYLVNGTSSSALFEFRNDDIRYFPVFRLGLTPFGDRLYFDNYLRQNNKILVVSIGIPTSSRGFDVRVHSPRAFRFGSGLSIGLALEAWVEPVESDVTAGIMKPGLMTKASIDYRLGILGDLGLLIEAGYKTYGYVPTEMLSSGFIGRVGISFRE
jgi:hypothetical protein